MKHQNTQSTPDITLKGVSVHNLKNVTLTIPSNKLIVFSGVSGSGKSSLAFDTIFVEGQRRFIESLSTSARRQLDSLEKPEAKAIDGISPTVAIEQKTAGNNPRSIVATMTGLFDFLRVLFARVATPYCPVSLEPVKPQSSNDIINALFQDFDAQKIYILAPYASDKKGSFKEDLLDLQRKGFSRLIIDGENVDLSETVPTLNHAKKHTIDIVLDRFKVRAEDKTRITESVIKALELSKQMMKVHLPDKNITKLYSTMCYSPSSGISYPDLRPEDFSFNHPKGMCDECEGLGVTQTFDLKLAIDEDLSISEDCFKFAGSYKTVKWGNIYNNLAEQYDFDVRTPFKHLSDKAKDVFLNGVKKKWIKMAFTHPTKKATWVEYVKWKGVISEAKKRYMEATSEKYKEHYHEYMTLSTCPKCHGSRLKPYPSHAKLAEKTIQDILQMDIADCLNFFTSIQLTKEQHKIAEGLLQEITRRLYFLKEVGLHYLSLERSSPTLSGGESQRVRLASQIGSGLVGATYILDEPSIGLHQRDNAKLIETLLKLRDIGNTVIVVEHDEDTLLAADHIVDVGPLAGQHGGEVLVNGSLQDLLRCSKSLTGRYLKKDLSIAIPKKRRKPQDWLTLKGATHHNLKNVTLKLPTEVMVAVCGISGSGKSSLIQQTLYPALSRLLHKSKQPSGDYLSLENTSVFDKVIDIDQSPIGRTPRSNPATYTKLFDDIRDLFANTKEAKALGFNQGRFSFNVKEGRCMHCSGMGYINIDMDFLENQTMKCPQCDGKRYDPNTLSILYKGKNIYDVLELSVDQALDYFENIPHIMHKLNLFKEVGLGYMRLGQSSTTLSGGEAQRIKLVKELVRPSTGRTLYIFDEPSTGLHFADIHKLVDIMQKLVTLKNTVLVIEHNLELIKVADYVIDMGPDGGKKGGYILAEGTPEKVSKANSPTAPYICEALNPRDITQRDIHYSPVEAATHIHISGAKQHNLKDVTLSLPKNAITCFTGPSGSGKSSLAFDTIYAEGQRRYIESLPSRVRQYVEMMPKAKVESITGLSPSIAIEQIRHGHNPRSTVGTLTEVYDYLRILYAKEGIAYCPETRLPIQSITKEYVLERIMEAEERSKVIILAPITRKAATKEALLNSIKQAGFVRLQVNKQQYDIDDDSIPLKDGFDDEIEIVVDRIILKPGIEKRILSAIEVAKDIGQNTLKVLINDEEHFYNMTFAVEKTGKSYPNIIPQTFSYNAPEGMCPECNGLGYVWGFNFDASKALKKLSIQDIFAYTWGKFSTKMSFRLLLIALKSKNIDSHATINELSDEQRNFVLNGSKTSLKYKKGIEFVFKGLGKTLEEMNSSLRGELKKQIEPLTQNVTCPTCHGHRLNKLALAVELNSVGIGELTSMEIHSMHSWMKKLELKDPKSMQEVVDQVIKRLHFLKEIGLGYLCLSRSAPTLSGGEMQRIRLARQLGAGLSGCIYVIDEPTIGLHPHNSHLLNKALIDLKNLNNTLVLVEHDPETISIADHLVDFGPSAGIHGGKVCAEGPLSEVLKHSNSLTSQYLRGEKNNHISLPYHANKKTLSLHGVSKRNINDLSCTIPYHALTVITGVSGSGKSTLLHEVIKTAAIKEASKKESSEFIPYCGGTIRGLDHFSKIIVVDQGPIGQTSRSDISTYTELQLPLRTWFASLPEAKIRGLMPKNFSFNHFHGMCKSCWGLGYKDIDLKYIPPVRVDCPDCSGMRLNSLSLKVTYKGKNFGELLKMTVSEAKEFLPPERKMTAILETLTNVGLSYVALGQEVNTLSGGEAQRLKLARELTKSTNSKSLILLDEPTTGLHFEDIRKLLRIFETMLKKKVTIVVIEHNTDIIQNAHHVIDMGPGAGEHGGKVIFEGSIEDLKKQKESYTAKYLISKPLKPSNNLVEV